MVPLGSLVCQPLQLGNWFTSLLSLQRSLRLTSYAVQLDALPFLFVKMKSQQNLLGSITTKSQSHSPLLFGAITAAIAGSLQAGFIGSVVPKDYSFTNTINVLIIVVFGGLGSMSGTVVAAIVLGILNMVLQDFSSVRMIIYSLALILVMIFRPGGLLGTWEFSLKKLLSKKEAN